MPDLDYQPASEAKRTPALARFGKILGCAVLGSMLYLGSSIPLVGAAIGYGDSNQIPPRSIEIPLIILSMPLIPLAPKIERFTKGILSDTALLFTLLALNGAMAGAAIALAGTLLIFLRERLRRADRTAE